MSNALTGTDKSVILLMTIGEDRAAEVFKHLSTREVQALSTAMANVRQISNKQLTEVLAEFEQEAEQFAALNINANEYLRSVLVKALGEERASSLLEDILETRDTTSGIETLNFMEPQSAADLIRDEHPQIIATILVHLKRGQSRRYSGAVRRAFTPRRDAAYRHLRRCAACRAGRTDRGTERSTRWSEPQAQQNGRRENGSRNYQPDENPAGRSGYYRRTRIRRRAGTENYRRDVPVRKPVDVDDRSIQRLLQEVDSESLLIALKGAEQPLREKFLRNMSQRAADILRDDLANRGPVRLSQVENEQKAILLIVRRLAETGEMVIGSGEDTYV